MNRSTHVTLLLLALHGVNAFAGDPVVKVKICRIQSVSSFDNQQADAILERCTKIMSGNQCPIRFQRDGDVKAIKATPILTPSNYPSFKYSRSFNEYHVRVFRFINGCGKTPGLVAGCSDVGIGRMSINVTIQPQYNSQTWLHEFGHNCGFPDVRDATKIMNWQLGPGTLGLEDGQCSKYLDVAVNPTNIAARSAAHAAVAMADGPAQPPIRIEEFVRGIYPHGVPFEDASKYKFDDLSKLIKMLDEPDLGDWRPNIVSTMCYIGDKTAIRPLLDYFGRGEGRLDDTEFTAKINVVLHLGELINLTHDDDLGLTFLLNSVTLNGSWEKPVPWTIADDEGNKIRDELLVTNAISGLGLTGSKKAFDKLKELEGNRNNEILAPYIKRSIKTFMEVREKGLINYRIELDKSPNHAMP